MQGGLSRITDRIYLSGVNELLSPGILNEFKKHNIKMIISCIGPEYAGQYHDSLLNNVKGLEIVYLSYSDVPSQNLWQENNVNDAQFISDGGVVTPCIVSNDYNKLPLIDIGHHWMNKYLAKTNGSVLVHCMAGISRSTSLIIYYLMRKYALSYDQAYQIVKKGRSIIQPNIGFESQLRSFDKHREKMIKPNLGKQSFMNPLTNRPMGFQ